MFWVFRPARSRAHAEKRGDSRMKRRTAACSRQLAERTGSPRKNRCRSSFGHNDLAARQLPSTTAKKLWLIDFEYAGFNTAMSDLAGTASNAGMYRTQQSRCSALALFLRCGAQPGASGARMRSCNAPSLLQGG